MSKRERVRLPRRVAVWKPKWEPEVKGWAFKYIRDNKWRYETINDIDDLMQDAYLVFLKVADAYPRVVEAPHFMALYKTSLSNYLTDKAREYGRKLDLIAEEHVFDDPASPTKEDLSLNTAHNEGPFYALIASGPPELQMLLAFMQDEGNLAELQKPQRKRRGQAYPRLNFDQRVSKLLGIENFPFKETFKQLLS